MSDSSPAPKQLAVQVRNVSKTFYQGGVATHALKNVRFEAHTGELAMIVGPSGCGKTTLLSVIAGTLNFDEGEIDVFDHALHLLPEEKITVFRGENIGFIFQHYHLIPTLNSIENISIPLLLNGLEQVKAIAIAEEMLEKVGLKGREKAYPRNLSGGEQQRIAIARALVHEPRLVICDEPTASLDADTGAKVLELIREVARAPDRCVIVVTHDARIFKYADSIAKMDDGRIK